MSEWRWRGEPETWVLGALALWVLVPALLLLGGDGVFNGSYGLQVGDQYQHMAFIRDAGENVLIASHFDLAPDPHQFLHPVFALSGLLWKLGASIQLSFLAWLPIAVGVVFAGFAAYVRRLLGADRGARLAALVLALFFFTPAAPLAEWLGGDAELRFGTELMGLEMFPGGYVWGGFAAAISVGLMPLFLLGIERGLEPARRRPGRSRWWYLGGAGGAGMLASWLHPWQGMVLLLVVGGLFAWSRFDRRYLALALPVALTVAPLAYFWALGQTDSSWEHISRPQEGYDHFGLWLVASLVPLALALPGYLRSPGDDLQERVLRLWPLAAFVVFFALQRTWFFHAFAGLSLPLAILAVRSWRELGLPRRLGIAAIVAVTAPGMLFYANEVRGIRAERFLAGGEARALDYLDSVSRGGGVLAPLETGQAVPAFAGRSTWVAHYYWTPDYGRRRDLAAALFSGRLAPDRARALVRRAGAPFLLSSCRRNADLRPLLRGMVVRTRRFGCATVYELRPSALQAQTSAFPSPRSGTPTS